LFSKFLRIATVIRTCILGGTHLCLRHGAHTSNNDAHWFVSQD
jgi:hypothetical protein